MNLTITNADRLPPIVRSELEALVGRINLVWAKEHDPQTGAHRTFTWAGDTQTTVGAAGAATALPATPTGYVNATLEDGTAIVIPYYAAS